MAAVSWQRFRATAPLMTHPEHCDPRTCHDMTSPAATQPASPSRLLNTALRFRSQQCWISPAASRPLHSRDMSQQTECLSYLPMLQASVCHVGSETRISCVLPTNFCRQINSAELQQPTLHKCVHLICFLHSMPTLCQCHTALPSKVHTLAPTSGARP